MFAIKEPFALHGLELLNERHDRSDRSLRKINARHRLLDLQWSMLKSLRIDLVPIIETKCHVAVLLHLENHQVAQRMNGPRADEDCIAGGWNEGCELMRYAAFCECFAQSVRRGLRRQARIDETPRAGPENDPRLGLAALANRQIFGLPV